MRGSNGLSREQVAEHQRTRLYEAMIEISADSGYTAATIKAVCSLAGVSRQTFYDLFDADREACFLGAFDHVVDRAASRVRVAYDAERDADRRLGRAFRQFLREIESEPQAARFALVEQLWAGPAAAARMDRGRSLFEGLIAASLSSPQGAVALSPTVATGIVGGVEQVTRAHLVAGRVQELCTKADELAAWASCYRPWSSAAPARTPRGPRPKTGLRCKDERLRILRAAGAIAAKDGYGALSAGRIARLAAVGEETFASLYGGSDGIERCFLGAFDLLGVEGLVVAVSAGRGASSPTLGVQSAITALLDHLARHPFLARLAFVEIFSVGPAAIERRASLQRRFAEQLVRQLPPDRRPSELVRLATVGAIWAMAEAHVARGRIHRLPELADEVTYLALAPVIGHEATLRLLIDGGGAIGDSQSDSRVEPHGHRARSSHASR